MKFQNTCLTALVIGSILNLPVFAQGTGLLEEIVVTATKRETNLQDTAMSVSAFTGEQLEQAGATDLREMQLFTPGLWVGGNAGFGTNPIVIRGIGSLITGIGADEAVGVYIDGIYQGRTAGNIFEFVDIDRVEVLRGPQGTLYGRNATGGAINVITKTPGDEFEGRVEGEVTSFDGWGARGYFLVPVSDNLGVKLSGGKYDRDGWIHNPTTGIAGSAVDKEYFSLGLHWTPSDRTTVDIRGYTGTSKLPTAYKDLNDGIDTLSVYTADHPNTSRREFTSVSGTITHDFDWFTAKAIVGYLETEVADFADSDGQAINNVQYRGFNESDQYSVELQFASTGSGPFTWLIGAFYFDESAEDDTPFNFFRDPMAIFGVPPGIGLGPLGLLFAAEVDTEAWAGFGELTFQPVDRITLTAGVRYSTESKDWLGCIGGFAVYEVDYRPDLCDASFVPDDDSWDAWTPHFVIDFQLTDDMLFYASATRGFRSGGWNWTAPTFPDTDNGFNPEFVWTYEGGMKTDLLDRRARFNVSGFYSDFTNVQVRTTDPNGLITIVNAATADIYGVEMELSATPVDNFNIAGTAAWLDATYAEFIGAGGNDLSGNRLNRSPEWQLSLMAQYTFPIGDIGTLTPRVEWQYVDEMFHDENNTQPQGSESFDIVNVKLRFESNDSRWGAELYARNADNTQYRAHSFQGILPNILPSQYSDPRIFGGKVFFNF